MTFEDDFPFPHFLTWRVIMEKKTGCLSFCSLVGPKDLVPGWSVVLFNPIINKGPIIRGKR